jgi:hypothetical protein
MFDPGESIAPAGDPQENNSALMTIRIKHGEHSYDSTQTRHAPPHLR